MGNQKYKKILKKILSNNYSLNYIQLDKCNINDDDLNVLLQAIYNNSLLKNNLQHMDLSNNKITKIHLQSLPRLCVLDLSKNKINKFTVSDVNSLKRVNLETNKLKSLLEKGLENVECLNISDNLLTYLEIDTMENLKFLLAKSNRISLLNISEKVNKLEKINLIENELTSFEIKSWMESLKEIYLSKNRITYFDGSNLSLEHVYNLNLSDNNIVSYLLQNHSYNKLRYISFQTNKLSNLILNLYHFVFINYFKNLNLHDEIKISVFEKIDLDLQKLLTLLSKDEINELIKEKFNKYIAKLMKFIDQHIEEVLKQEIIANKMNIINLYKNLLLLQKYNKEFSQLSEQYILIHIVLLEVKAHFKNRVNKIEKNILKALFNMAKIKVNIDSIDFEKRYKKAIDNKLAYINDKLIDMHDATKTSTFRKAFTRLQNSSANDLNNLESNEKNNIKDSEKKNAKECCIVM